ncbi:hypothetical protein RI367_007144 [Sorochytrium milnesiophthora]
MARIVRIDALADYACANNDQVYVGADASQKHALVAVSGEGVYIVNAQDSKTVRSWSVSPKTAFSGAPVWLSTSDSLYVVMEGHSEMDRKDARKVLWSWPAKADKLHPASATMERTIASVFACAGLADFVVCCHDDGALSVVDVALSSAPRLFAHLPTPSSTLLCAAPYTDFAADEDEPLALIVQAIAAEDRYYVQVVSASLAHDDLDTALVLRTELRAAAVQRVHFDSELNLLSVLYTDRQWDVYRIAVSVVNGSVNRSQVTLVTSHADAVPAVPTTSTVLPGYLVTTNIRQDRRIAVALLDNTFGTLQHEFLIPKELVQSLDTQNTLCMSLCALSGSAQLLFAITEQAKAGKKAQKKATKKTAVFRIALHRSPSTLLSVLGKSSNAAATKAPGAPHMHMPSAADPQSWHTMLQDRTILERNGIASLEKARSSAALENVFFSIVQRMTKMYPKQALALPTEKSAVWQMSQHFTAAVIALMLNPDPSASKPSVFSARILQHLLQTQVVSNASVPGGLLAAMRARNLPALVNQTLQCVRDITEMEIVAVLKDLLASDERLSSELALFALILQYPHTDLFVQQALHTLSSDELVRLLKVILRLAKALVNGGAVNKALSAIDMNVLGKWVGHVLDAHFATIALNSELGVLLTDFSVLLSKDLLAIQPLEQAVGALQWFMALERDQRQSTQEFVAIDGKVRKPKVWEVADAKYSVEYIKI